MSKASHIAREVVAMSRTSILVGIFVAALLALVAPSAASATALPEKITENMTLPAAGNPYTGSSVTIEAGVTVQAEPGVVVKFSGSLSNLTVNGTLKAEGTAESPILFTSTSDSAAGQWSGINLGSASGSSVLKHVEVRSAKTAITVASNAQITNSSLHDNWGALKVTSASPQITNNTITKNQGTFKPFEVSGGGSPEIAFNTITKNGAGGGSYVALSYTATGSQTGAINIHDNVLEENNAHAISISTGTAPIKGTTLSGNVIKNNSGFAINYSGDEVPADIANNTLSGNTDNSITLAGTLRSSATWGEFGGIIKLGELTVASGNTLTIAPGRQLKGSGSLSNLTVNGTLKAEGTAESPILFTSTSDSAAGQWSGINLGSASGSSVLKHVEVRSAKTAITVASNAQITNSSLHDNWGALKVTSASPQITNNTITKNQGTFKPFEVSGGGSPEIAFNTITKNGAGGGSYVALSYTATGSQTGAINIHDNVLEENNAHAISISTGTAPIKGTTLSGNVIKNNSGFAINYSGDEVPADIANNTLSGNTDNSITLAGTLRSSATWGEFGGIIKLGELTVASGNTLTIAPGRQLKGSGSLSNLTVNGTLKAEGTAESPILFTSTSDSAAGQWSGINLGSASGSSVLKHVEVRSAKTAITVASNAQITNSSLHDNWGALKVTSASPQITNNTITKNQGTFKPFEVSGGGSPEIAFNTITKNGAGGGSYVALSYTATGSQTGAINIHDNVLEENNAHAISISTGTAPIKGTTLSGNVIIKNLGSGLTYSGPDIPGNISENLLIANTTNYIEVSGTVANSSTWKDAGTPVAPKGVTVASGVTLKVTKGVLMLNPNFTVKGTLQAEGTQGEPVVFTGVKEAGPGEWSSIKFEPGSGASVLDHTEIAFGGSSSAGMVAVVGSSPTITNSTIRRSQNYGIKVTESGAPKIERNRFRGNANGLYYSGTGKLAAPSNDWGCANGPKPAGCGDSVTSNVNWKPAIQLEELAGHCRGQASQCGEGADPVSLATGQLSYSHRDLLLTNKGEVPLEFTRAYSSGSSADTGLGPGWSQTGLLTATELELGAVLLVRQDGRQDLFQKTETGYKAPSGVTDTLAKVEGTFQLTTLQGTVYRFDESGRIASIADDHGLKTTYGYNAEGRLATITDPSAQTLTFSYDASNHITKVTDSTGREVKYTYSGAGDLATVTDALGGITEYTYDSEHRLKTIKDPRGNVILKNTYDGQGRIVEQRDGLENLWLLEYKTDETIVTEPEGGKLTYEFDGQDRVVSETDQLGKTTTTSYDGAGNVDEIVKPGGAKWQFGYDAKGNLTSVIDAEEGDRSYEYDGLNRLTEFTDEREETWAYEWSEANDLKKVTDPAEGETTFTHDAAGLPLTVTDPNEHTTTFTYDTRGNRLTAKDALEHTTTFTYNTRNQLTSKTAPGLAVETYGRNALGDLLSVTTPEGHKTEYAYDANGMRTKVTDPAEGVWEIKRDAMERPTAYVDPLGKETKIEYDGNFNSVKVTDRRGKETTYAYNLVNQLTEIVRPEGGDWEFGYDARGNRIEVIDPRENATTYEFDLLNRMTEAAEPLEATTSYAYDPAGNLTSFTDPRENTSQLAYDELGRLTEIDQPLEKTTSFTYDGAGNQLTQTTAAGTVDFAYDAANRLEEISDGESVLRAYEYDAADRMIGATDAQADEIEIGHDDDGRVVSINDGRGQTMTREYDSRGNVVKQTDGRGMLEYGFDKLSRMTSLTDPQSKALDFAYDPEDNLTKVELPNGVITTNEFDNAGRLAVTTSSKGETTLETLEYEYDSFGNRIGQVDRLAQETTYDYDALNRLIEFDPPGEGSTSYDYDAAGNRIEAGATTYAFNALNQLTSASSGTTYDYDDAGRLVEVDEGEESTTYGWSLLDELTSADTGAQEIDYAYDAFGRQVLRDDGSTIRPSHYGDLSDLPILDTDAEGKPTMSYVQGPEGLVEQRSGEATSFPLRDAHGDITTLADGEGEVASRQTYDPWGDQLSGPSLEMGWLGAQQRRTDPSVDLSQMGVRVYGLDQGSFLSEDPMLGRYGKGQSLNRYAYVQGNPINYFDLDGRITIEIPGTPIELHPMLPTPGNPIPELPVTIDGVPSLPELINNQIPNLPFEDDIEDRANDFIKNKGGEVALGCLGGGLGGLGVLNAMSGGAPIFIPGVGWVTELGAAALGCGIGAAGNSVLGINPVRTR